MPKLGIPPRHWPWLLLFAGVGFWLNSWWVPLFDLDEGAFTEATREMFARGDFLMTWLDGAPRYDKPILTYWLQALSVQVFGFTEFALRLPSMLAASAWMLVVYAFVRDYAPDRSRADTSALFAAAVLALSPVPGLIGHAATADALLNLWITLTFTDAWRWLDTLSKGVTPSHALRLRAWCWMGLGLLTKGPISVGLPVLVMVPWALLQKRFKDLLSLGFYLPGWMVLALVVMPWAVMLSLRDGGDFLRHFLLDHNVGRYSQTMESHGGHWWYYLAVLPLILLPFAAWIPTTVAGLLRDTRSALGQFLWLWFGVVLLMFSASATQLPHYLLYGATAFIIAMAFAAPRLQGRGWAAAPALVFLTLLVALPWILPAAQPPAHRLYDRAVVVGVQAALNAPLQMGLGLALALAVWLTLRVKDPIALALRTGVICAVAAWGAVLPLLAAGQQRPVQAAAAFARAHQLAPVVSYRIAMPSFSVYRGDITPARPPQKGDVVYTRIDRRAALAKDTGGMGQTVLFQQGGIVLLRLGDSAIGLQQP